MPDIRIRHPLRNDGTDHHPEVGALMTPTILNTNGTTVLLEDPITIDPTDSWRALDDPIGDLINERGEKYGPPSENHQITADLWTAYLSRKLGKGARITAREVCWMNTMQKASRDTFVPDSDNVIDGQGYLRNAERIAEKEKTHE